jgi:four helix bundle protein
MSIAQREALESACWLRLVKETNLISATAMDGVSAETEELVKILSSILITLKQGRQKT